LKNIVAIEVVDNDPSYGFFGKVVCASGISGFTHDQVLDEALELKTLFPSTNYSFRYVERVPAAV